jgi:hypothetical protein
MSKVSVFSVKITRIQYSKWIIITNHMGFEDDANIQTTKEISYVFTFEDYF